MAHVSGLWVSPEKGSGRMDARERVQALTEHGFEGCAHARPGQSRQVLFASAEHLRSVGVDPGRIRENLTIEGADVQQWPVGQRVGVGDAVFEITMVCDPCERMDALRPGLREELDGKRGMLARVVEGGELVLGDEVRLL
jgi:MOSC domain-containing protein YiiM